MTTVLLAEGRVADLEVGELLTDSVLDLELRVLAGRQSMKRVIAHPRIQKSGLALVGHLHGINPKRVQVLGETELSYLEHLDDAARRRAAQCICSLPLSCILVTRGAEPPACLLEEADRQGCPVLLSRERSSRTIMALHAFLDDRLAPRGRLHAVLMDLFEVGVLLLGESGVGKSEAALELVMKGHRLVADDIVEFDFRPPGSVFGEPAALLKHHIEVRGLGILDIQDLYGVTAVRARKRVDLVVQLERWREGFPYDRLGVDDEFVELLGAKVRAHRIPVRPGRNTAAIIEIAARNELLRRAGRNAARDFLAQLEGALLPAAPSSAPGAPRLPTPASPSPVVGPESALPPPRWSGTTVRSERSGSGGVEGS